jgi:hypothetical protein
MATTLRIKRRVSGGAGAPSSLKTGELAWNMADGIIYGGKGDDGGGNATSVVAIAKDGFVDPSTLYQPLDADLTNLAGLDATAGYLVKTGANTHTRRTLTGTAQEIAVTNGDGTTGNPVFSLAAPTIGGSGSGSNYTKVSVDTKGRISSTGQAILNDIGAPTSTYSFGAQLVQSSATPAGNNDLTNKLYVDNSIAAANLGQDAKESVRLASTANQALSGGTAFPTIDGVQVAAGNRVLLKSQTASAENGIYVVGGTGAAWTFTRATDFDAWSDVPGATIAVEEGSTLADSIWLSIANSGGTLGTTAISFTRIDAGAGGGFTIAGAGLTSSGSTIDVVAGTGISVAGDNVALTGQALALHNATIAADQILYGTGAGTFSTTGFTSVARTLNAQTTQALMRSTGLGLGTIATQDANAVAITGGTIDGVTLDGGTF